MIEMQINHMLEPIYDGNMYAVCVGAYKNKNKANSIVEDLKKKGYTST